MDASSPRRSNGHRCAVEPVAPRHTDGERTARSSRRQVVATGKRCPCREEVQLTDVSDAPDAAGRPANLNGRSAAAAASHADHTDRRESATSCRLGEAANGRSGDMASRLAGFLNDSTHRYSAYRATCPITHALA